MGSLSLPLEADTKLVEATLSSAPFVSVEGVINIRDFGGYPTAAGARIRPLRLYRSGELNRVTERGQEQVRALGIRKVYDLRADGEIAKYKSATPSIQDVEFVRASVLEEMFDPVSMAQRLQSFATDEAHAFLSLYTHVLESGGSALEKVLLHLRDRPDEPLLVHCTAGKDRTGVFAAVILMLLGARDEDIINDYALTTIGLQPALPMLAVRFSRENAFKDNWAGTVNMATAKPDNMQAVLKFIRNDAGGVEAYLKSHTSLTEEDFARIRANYLVYGEERAV